MIFRTTSFPAPSELILLIVFVNSNVSLRMSIAGVLKNFQCCVVLKASMALSWSTTEPGMLTMLPNISELVVSFAVKSRKPGISSAFVLLSTIRLRMAFRSPGAGGLPLASTPRFFFCANVVFAPRLGGNSWLAFTLGFGPAYVRRADVVKDA